ncbi:TNF receptor-associated factor 5-like [Dysidea avara]|uniref:TNF receptor-associated factor 5-like n=1 Tax=Dysidea avara TaxID=196820 RepID=UPI00331DA2BD
MKIVSSLIKPYDSLLQWPFINKVTLTLINQTGGPDVTDTFKPDPKNPKSSSFQRPKTEMNVASGCPRFVPLDDLYRNARCIQARSQE